MKPKDWDSFFAAQKDDTVNEWCAELIWRYYGEGGIHESYRVILVTGRPSKYMGETEVWLKDNDIRYDYLYMRPDELHDYLKTEIVVLKCGGQLA
jgi:hypothetical protein